MIYVIAFIFGYFAFLAALSWAARPYRRKLFALIDELLDEYGFEKGSRAFLLHRKDTAYSFRAAPIMMLGYWIGLIIPTETLKSTSESFEEEHQNDHLFSDKRIMDVVSYYHASIAAVNPIFGAFLFASKGLFLLKLKWHFRSKEPPKPFLTTSVSLQP